MSAENVELVRRLFEAYRTRDNLWPFEVYDPGIEVDVRGQPELVALDWEPVYRGHDGFRRWGRHWLSAWGSIDFHVDDLIDAGDEVVALISQVNRGRASGVEVAMVYAWVWTLQDGMVMRLRVFGDRTEALRAVGLE
jgi:ketosteroid isomerase-like protein